MSTCATESDLKEMWVAAHDALHDLERARLELRTIDNAVESLDLCAQTEALCGPRHRLIEIMSIIDVIQGEAENIEDAREKNYASLEGRQKR